MNRALYSCKNCGIVVTEEGFAACPSCGYNPDDADWKKSLRIGTEDIRRILPP